MDTTPVVTDDVGATTAIRSSCATSIAPTSSTPPTTAMVADRLVVPDRLAGDPRPVAFPRERWEGSFADDAAGARGRRATGS